MNSQIGKLQDLMGNLIDWSSLEVRNFQKKEIEFDFSELAEKVLEKYQNQFEKKQISLETELEKELKVNGDKEMIRKSIENLLTNSLKFTLKGGSVTVSTKKESGKCSFQFERFGNWNERCKNCQYFQSKPKSHTEGNCQ